MGLGKCSCATNLGFGDSSLGDSVKPYKEGTIEYYQCSSPTSLPNHYSAYTAKVRDVENDDIAEKEGDIIILEISENKIALDPPCGSWWISSFEKDERGIRVILRRKKT